MAHRTTFHTCFIFTLIYATIAFSLHYAILSINSDLYKYIDSSKTSTLGNSKNAEEIANASKQVQILNEEQKIYNLDIFGPVTETTNVIVIQTHMRLAHIDALIKSLSYVAGINDSLLIFSNDVIMPSMNAKIQRIRFARVMQIFYPYSIQLHPDRFPGPDPNDTYSNTWNPYSAQVKLHWWWKANFVFDQIRVLKNYSRVISFTEEDVIFAADALWILNLMEKSMVEDDCRGCVMLSISDKGNFGIVPLILWGTPGYSAKKTTDYAEGLVMPVSPFPSVHLGFNRTLWEKVKKCSNQFCEYNDYNRDLSLAYEMKMPPCTKERLKHYALKWPRVFHSGNCGIHKKEKNCNPGRYLKEMRKMYGSYGPKQFPMKLGNLHLVKKVKSYRSFGEMDNPKIVELCKSMVQGYVSEAANQIEI